MSQRKLLQEIDKVFKKVKEGLEIFDGYYDKLQNCESQSQKEKIEGDLKREIKKLQRQRDQIKNWLSGNDVKDKNNLLENRRLIENAMERFKTVEKDMKTKAFSKEGLSMQRIDPKEKEKNEQSDFIHQQLEELQQQSEKHEATIDQIHSSVKKGKKLDNAKQQEIEGLNELISRNQWHSEKMELILRLLANDDIESEQVAGLQEDIKYYVENNEDVDFIEDDGIYDELGLEDIEDMYGHVGDYPHAEEAEHESETAAQSPKQQTHTPQKKSSVSAQPSAPSTAASNHAAVSNTPFNSTSSTTNHHHHQNNGTFKPPGLTSTISNNAPSPSTTPGLTTLKPSVAPLKTDLKYSSVLSAGVNSNNNTPTSTTTAASVAAAAAAAATATANSATTSTTNNVNTPPASNTILNNNNNNNNTSTATPPPPGLSKTNTNVTNDSREATQSPVLIPSGYQDLIPSFEKTKLSITNPLPFEKIAKILETSLLNCPDSLDADRPKIYTPNNPHPTSIYYPQDPLPELSYTSVVSKLDENTLFYNFYFDQGKYIQIQNANELVKRGWIFNKLNKKWWKKFEDIQPPPTPLTNGSTINNKASNENNNNELQDKKFYWKYFDYEDTWLPRRKDEFVPNTEELVNEF